MSGLFKISTPSTPTVTSPTTMPDQYSATSQEASRKATAQASQYGRSSTILTTAASRAGSTLAGSSTLGTK